MENKKNAPANLSKSRSLYLNIGLVLSLTFILAAFEWKSYDSGSTIGLVPVIGDFPTLVEIPPTIQPPPPPPLKMIIEVDDKVELVEDIKPEIDVETVEDTKISDLYVEDIKDEINADSVFLFVENQPSYKGGYAAFYKYIGKQMKYPSQARKMGVEGRVILSFVVSKSGTITSIKVLRGIGAGCDEEAIRVLQNAPQWTPGKQRGTPVNVSMTLPITFKLN